MTLANPIWHLRLRPRHGRVVVACDQNPGAFILALDRATGRQAWKIDRPTVRIGWSTPIVYAPAPNRTDVVVMGGTRLDAYDLATGALHWWMPIGSGDALGTAMIVGDTLLASTLGSNEPGLPSLAATLAKYDTNKDGRLSLAEFKGDKDMGEHFGWIDKNDDKVIVAAEWEAASAVYIGEYGAIPVRLNQAQGQLPATVIAWRFKKNIPYIPAALVYQNVFYMVKTGGIVTSLDAGTGKLLREGRATGALGEYYASPIAADGKVFLSSNEGKITVLKAAGEWEVLAVNDIGDEIRATPALSEGRPKTASSAA